MLPGFQRLLHLPPATFGTSVDWRASTNPAACSHCYPYLPYRLRYDGRSSAGSLHSARICEIRMCSKLVPTSSRALIMSDVLDHGCMQACIICSLDSASHAAAEKQRWTSAGNSLHNSAQVGSNISSNLVSIQRISYAIARVPAPRQEFLELFSIMCNEAGSKT